MGDSPKVGQFVSIRQVMGGRDQQLPFLVTQVHEEEGTISGVAFSGMPHVVQWARCAQDFTHVKPGNENRQWLPLGVEPQPEPEPAPEPVPEPEPEQESIPEPSPESDPEPEVEPIVEV